MNGHRRTNTRHLVVALFLTLVALPTLGSAVAGAAAIAATDLTVKGFVTAKSGTALVLREGSKRLVVAVTSSTRVMGERDSFDAIAPHDLIRAEGRMVGNRLAATRVEVLLTAQGLRDRPQPKELEIDLLTIDMSR